MCFVVGWLQAGADAILIHSNLKDHSEIESFMKAWASRHPVVIVPTKYYTTPTDTFRDWGVNMVWRGAALCVLGCALRMLSLATSLTAPVCQCKCASHALTFYNSIFFWAELTPFSISGRG
jgi:hypothetical protein